MGLINISAEQSIIGVFLRFAGQAEIHSNRLSADDFSDGRHAMIFNAIRDAVATGQPASMKFIAERLRAAKQLAIVTPSYLTTLYEETGTSAGIDFWIERVRQLSRLRAFQKVANELCTEAGEQEEDAESFFNGAVLRLVGLLKTPQTKQALTPISDLVDMALTDLNSRVKNNIIPAEPTGLNAIDRLIGGLRKQNLIVVAARPGMGKSALATGWAVNQSRKKPTVLFSLEMAGVELAQRILSDAADISFSTLNSAVPTGPELYRAKGAGKTLLDNKLFIDTSPVLRVADIRARCIRLKAVEGELGAVIVDYLQLLRPENRRDPREQQVSQMSRNLKALAKELDVPVVALSQLNRANEARPDKRPRLSDLRESGAIEQDADLVIFVHRPSYYRPGEPDDGLAELIIAKNRNGRCGKARVRWAGDKVRFENAC